MLKMKNVERQNVKSRDAKRREVALISGTSIFDIFHYRFFGRKSHNSFQNTHIY